MNKPNRVNRPVDRPVTDEDEYQEFHCSAEWHLAYLSKAASLIYPWALRLSKKSRRFRVSPRQAAAYFKIAPRTAQLAYEQLKKSGFFELLESGQAAGETSIYKPVSHREWAEKHPGKCATRIEFAWTPENDRLGQELFSITGGRVRFRKSHIVEYRKSELGDQTIADLFRVWYPQYRADQVSKAEQMTGRKAKAWRKWVGCHFNADCLRPMSHSLKEHPGEREKMLENALAGLPLLAHRLPQIPAPI